MQMFIAILMLFVMPALIGAAIGVIIRKITRFGLSEVFITGVIIQNIIYEIIAVKLILEKSTLTDISIRFTVSVVVFAAILCVAVALRLRKHSAIGIIKGADKKNTVNNILNIAIIVLIIFQCVHMWNNMSFYLYDSTFEMVNTTVTTDSIYQYNIYTGDEVNYTPTLRQAVFSHDIYISMLAQICNIKPIEFIGRYFSVYVLIVSYAVMFIMSKLIFDEKLYQKYFILLSVILTAFSNYSSVSAETMLILKPWTIESFFAKVIIPLAICITIVLYKNIRQRWNMRND